MKELKFEKPTSVEEISQDGNIGKFIIKPLDRGYGTTLGNSLRRVLLSSLPGAAIVNVKIEGVEHEFSTIKGVYEDVMGIILNLKKVIFKVDSNNPNFEQKLDLYIAGPTVVKASDIERVDGVEVVNPDQVICTVAEGGYIQMELTVRRGSGYVNAKENKKYTNNYIGIIPIDSIYTPIVRVSYNVEKIRNDNDELIMEIETNGSINAKEALALSAKMLMDYLNEIVIISEKAEEAEFIYEQEEDVGNKKLETKIDDLELSVRLFNSLKRAGINTVGDIVKYSVEDVMKLKSLGRVSFKELKDKLLEYGLDFEGSSNDYKITDDKEEE